ncbi:MAG: class I SAM-dependent methyltransferase [Woeseia sp.]
MEVHVKQLVPVYEFDRLAANWIMKFVGNPRIALRLWDGHEFYFADGAPVGVLEFLNRSALLDLLFFQSVGFGEGYSKGKIRIHGNLLDLLNEAAGAVTGSGYGSYYFDRFRSLLRAIRGNTLARSRDNVHHHYDLGNDFYEMWLDERMVYTCAYYDNTEATLAEAQFAKLDHVCRKLDLKPGQQVIEAGCGWGALAMHMAEHYGVKVKAYNNSHEQVAYARKKAAARGLDDRVEFVEDDYRTISDECDVFVSIGMLEHVGRRNYHALGRLIDRCLKRNGVGLIHSIGRSHPRPVDPWITKRIFPGGYVPSLGEITSIFEPHRFSVVDVENLRLHYARTCRDWLQNFEKVSDQVADMYNEEFMRAWRLYLAGSSAAFQSGTLQLYQVLFAPHGNNDVPWSRRYQYAPDTTKG